MSNIDDEATIAIAKEIRGLRALLEIWSDRAAEVEQISIPHVRREETRKSLAEAVAKKVASCKHLVVNEESWGGEDTLGNSAHDRETTEITCLLCKQKLLTSKSERDVKYRKRTWHILPAYAGVGEDFNPFYNRRMYFPGSIRKDERAAIVRRIRNTDWETTEQLVAAIKEAKGSVL